MATLFPTAAPKRPGAVETLAIVALYAFGLFLWRYFFNGGDIPLELHDWAQVSAPRLAFLQDAVSSGELPLHMPGSWALNVETDRYLGIVDTIVSPQVVLLRWMQIGQFVLANTLLLYTLGFVGLVLVRLRFDLSFASFAALYLLLFLNGHLTAHLAVGHLNWSAYLLLPYLAFLILWLFDHPPQWSWIAGFSGWMLVIWLNGAFHLYVASLMLVGLLFLSHAAQRRTLLLAALLSLGVAAIRLLPPILELAKFDTAFISGYSTVGELLTALTTLREPVPAQAFADSLINPLGWWEKDYYLGAIGFAFVAVSGPIAWIQKAANLRKYLPLATPLVVMLVLSIGRVSSIFGHLNLPLLDSQRVSTRLLVIPITLLTLLAVLAFEQLMKRKSGWSIQLLATAGLALLAHDLWQHVRLWRVVNMPGLFPARQLDLGLNVVANHPDRPYVVALGIGTLVSLACLIGVVVPAFRSRRSVEQTPGEPRT